MSVLSTVNGADILGGAVTMPRVGVWQADIDVDASSRDPFIQGVEVLLGSQRFVGMPTACDVVGGRVKMRIAGGKGGLPKDAAPRFYRAIPARVPLGELLSAVGETLSKTSSKGKLDLQLPFWTRPKSTTGEALEELAWALDCDWRILDDGTVWVGTETWPDAVVPGALVLDEAPEDNRAELSSDEPSLRPGTTFNGKRVGRVVHTIDSANVRTTVYYDTGEDGGDVLRAALAKVIRQETRTIDYLAMYRAQVVGQNKDGSLELKLDSPKFPGMSRIPIRYGIPGVRVEVASGARVCVEFEGGEPMRPCATVWEPDSLKSITITASEQVTIKAPKVVTQDGRPLARVGDLVSGTSTPPGSPFVGQIVTGNNAHRG